MYPASSSLSSKVGKPKIDSDRFIVHATRKVPELAVAIEYKPSVAVCSTPSRVTILKN